MTAHEVTGWRDQWISERHRLWGADLPMLDVDTVWCEYDRHVPRLLTEYKRENAPVQQANHDALVNLARMADLPALGVRYWPSDAVFIVSALNSQALDVFNGVKVQLCEREYVAVLHRFRNQR